MLFSITRSVTFALLAIFNLKCADMVCHDDKPKYDFVRGLLAMIAFLFALCALFSALVRA